MFLWRISNHADLDGRGGLLASARWHRKGRPVVYLATSPAGALIEVLVHLELAFAEVTRMYHLAKIEVDDNLQIPEIGIDELPHNWQLDHEVTRELGSRWLVAGTSALVRVPSAIVPETSNILLNPSHADAKRLRVLWHREFPWDERLIRR